MFLAAFVAAYSRPSLTPADYEVTSLPGLKSSPAFKHYAGLVPIGDGAGTELFFWFVESARSPADDPLVFWTNGGPGASSVAYGFWTEHGPFRLQNGTDGTPPPPPPPPAPGRAPRPTSRATSHKRERQKTRLQACVARATGIAPVPYDYSWNAVVPFL